jgi:hypothetical protein
MTGHLPDVVMHRIRRDDCLILSLCGNMKSGDEWERDELPITMGRLRFPDARSREDVVPLAFARLHFSR